MDALLETDGPNRYPIKFNLVLYNQKDVDKAIAYLELISKSGLLPPGGEPMPRPAERPKEKNYYK